MIVYTPHRYKTSRTRREFLATRLTLALSTGIPLLLTFMVPIKGLLLFECPFLTLTGLPCPFCGFTRSIWAISAGDWTFATINSPLSWLPYTTLAILFGWNTGQILLGSRSAKPLILPITRAGANQAVGMSILLILLNWIYRLSTGLA